MAKLHLEILALANYADFSKDGKLSIVGIFDQLYSPKLPTSLLKGFIAFTVAGAEVDKDISLNVEILDPKNKSVASNPVNLRTGSNGKANFTIELVGMPLPSNGIYTIVVNYGKNELGSTSFEVIKVTEQDERSTKVGRPIN